MGLYCVKDSLDLMQLEMILTRGDDESSPKGILVWKNIFNDLLWKKKETQPPIRTSDSLRWKELFLSLHCLM